MFSGHSQLRTMEEHVSDPFDRLPDEVYQLIFLAVADCKSLVRCMAVSKAFREHSERVSMLSIVCPGQFTSYADKLQRIYTMVRRFYCLEVLIVRVGQPKDEPPSWARCMRYAEIGLSVEKFVFMAAKTGEFSEFDSALRGAPVMSNERREMSSSESEAEGTAVEAARNGDEGSRTGGVSQEAGTSLSFDESSSSEGAHAQTSGIPRSSFKDRVIPEFNLRQVVAPSNDVLKRMVPVIVFAIVQGLDEFRDSVPTFISKFESLRTFLLVDMLESVTVFMREHQIQQIRSHLQHMAETGGGPGPIREDDAASESEATAHEEDEVAAIEDREVLDADDERTEMSKHDAQAPPAQDSHCFRSLSINEGRSSMRGADGCSSDKKGKALEIVGDELNSNRKGKGKEGEPMAESSSGPSSCSGEQNTVHEVKSDEVDEDEVTSPLRHGNSEEGSIQNSVEVHLHSARDSCAGGCSSSAQDHQGGGKNVASYHPGFPLSSSEEDGRLDMGGDERTSSDDGSETWRNCRGICIHGPGDGRGEFMSKYPFKRNSSKGRESRSTRVGSFRRQEKSAAWMDESVRRRQESRIYKGLSFRRREESRAFKTWRLGKRERDEEQPESCSSSSSTSVPGAELGESRSHAAAENAAEITSSRQAAGVELPSNTNNNVASSLEPQVGGSECSSHSHDNTEERPRSRDDDQRHFRWGRTDFNSEQQQQQQHGLGGLRGGIAPLEARGVRLSQREAWREAWRETWGERLGRRARELRREMQSQAAAEMEREGLRRERLREGVRKRQMEIEREALQFDITFWRAEQVVARGYSLTDVSMCIATHASKPLDVSELERMSCSALAGPLLAATIAHVNQQAGFHNL